MDSNRELHITVSDLRQRTNMSKAKVNTGGILKLLNERLIE